MKAYRKSARTFDIETEQAICKDYEGGLTLSGLAAKYGSSASVHRRVLIAYNVPRTRKRLYYREDVFDKIDTNLKAYVLGLLTADGYIVNDLKRHRYVVQLGSTDKEIPLAFAELIDYGRDLYHIRAKKEYRMNKDEWRIMVCSKRLVLALMKLDVMPRKSTKEIFCKAVPQHLLRHYIRGLCDGDGSLGIYSSQRIRPSAMITFFGSKQLLDSIALVFHSETSIPSKVSRRKDKQLFKLGYSGNNVCRTIASWLYLDCHYYLPRKMEIARQMMIVPVRACVDHDYRISQGLCEVCGKPRGEDGTTRKCRTCADRFNELNKNRRKRLLEAGLCRDCQDPRGGDGTTILCRKCADRRNAQLRQQKAKE